MIKYTIMLFFVLIYIAQTTAITTTVVHHNELVKMVCIHKETKKVLFDKEVKNWTEKEGHMVNYTDKDEVNHYMYIGKMDCLPT